MLAHVNKAHACDVGGVIFVSVVLVRKKKTFPKHMSLIKELK